MLVCESNLLKFIVDSLLFSAIFAEKLKSKNQFGLCELYSIGCEVGCSGGSSDSVYVCVCGYEMHL